MLSTVQCRAANRSDTEADTVPAIERRRLLLLVAGDTVAAAPLHAPDFQLINPVGETLSRTEYLTGIASGSLDYLIWMPDSIQVRVFLGSAVLRYSSQLSIVAAGDTAPLRRHWHTDLYEKRNGAWQVVWSQATSSR